VVKTRCTVSCNEAIDTSEAIGTAGAGIANAGQMTLTGCLVTNNTSARTGGGIQNRSTPQSLTLDASHVTSNTASINAGGIQNDNGTVTLQNSSTVTGNSAPNCGGTITGPGCA
jgi:hypothetical protein